LGNITLGGGSDKFAGEYCEDAVIATQRVTKLWCYQAGVASAGQQLVELTIDLLPRRAVEAWPAGRKNDDG